MTHQGARGDTIAAGGLLTIALLLGGGSALFPLYRTLVEFVAVLVLAWFCLRSWSMPATLAGRVAVLLAAAMIVLPLLQLVPLPTSWWQALPGRQLLTDSRVVLGTADMAAPLTMAPSATRDVVAFALVPLAMFVAAMRLGRDGQRLMVVLIAAMGVLNGLLVILQFQGMSALTLFTTGNLPGTGLFANKNHCAIFLVLTLPALASAALYWPKGSPSFRRAIGAGLVGFLSLAVFGCLSRAGIALLPVGLVASAAILLPRLPDKKQFLMICGALAIGSIAIVALLLRTNVVAQALDRFELGNDERALFWPVVKDAIALYFPAGSGFGTFRNVFAAIEPVSIVQPAYVNHAHSDYLEIALEGGILAIVLLGLFILWYLATTIASMRAIKRNSRAFALILFAVTGIACLLLHSFVDYPLRTLSLSAVLAVLCAILATPISALDLERSRSYRGSGRTHGNTARNSRRHH